MLCCGVYCQAWSRTSSVEVSSLEDLVLSGSSWRNFLSQPSGDWDAVWTHPELLPRVALINRTNISLTLLCLSWQNPVLPALQSLDFNRYDWTNRWGVILLFLATCGLQACYLGTALVPLVLGPGSKGSGSPFPWDQSAYHRGLPRAVSGRQVSFCCRVLAAGQWLWFFEYLNHIACQDGLIVSPRQVGSMGVAEPVSGLRVAFSSSNNLFLWRKHMCILWDKENMIIFCLESDIVSSIICCLLTNSIPLKYNFAC